MTFLDRFESLKEGNRLEFKLAQGGFPKSFWETYSAFANTAGGVIVLGVEETSLGARTVGVSDPDALVQDLWNGLNNPQRVSANLLVDSDISVEQVDGAEVVVVKVPRADRLQRPVYINNSMNAGAYRRNGEGDYHCSMEAIRAMVRDSFDGAIDRDIVDGVGLDALNGDSVRRYRNEFASIRLNHPWIDLPDEEFLVRLGAIARSNDDGALHPTKAGLLMFGEAWRIVDSFPNFFLDCRRISGTRRWDDRVTSDSGDWSGNVYDFWNKAYLMLCEGLPRPFELSSGMSRIDDTPQHRAVREGLTNALVHADYYGRTGVVAIRRNSTVEFSNPGSLRLPVEVVEGGGVSDPRNKTLMTMFNLIGRGDKAGSGFDAFRDAAAYAGVVGPELEEFLDPDRTKLTLHVQMDGSKLMGMGKPSDVASVVCPVEDNVGNVVSNGAKDDGNVGHGVNNGADGVSDNPNVVRDDVSSDVNGVVSDVSGKPGGLHGANYSNAAENVLDCIRIDPEISAAGIAEKLSISARQAQRHLRQLRENGHITRVGKTNGYWKIND